MTRDSSRRLDDIDAAIERCLSYRAVKSLPDEVTALSPETPWTSIAGLRNVVVHEYFRVNRDLIEQIVDNELTALVGTIRGRLRDG